jgi:type IV secretory pathway protease TraF
LIARALIVFLAVAAGDVCWARYTSACAKGTRWTAASWGVGLYALGAISVVNYTVDHRLIVPALLGAFVGTALGVKK